MNQSTRIHIGQEKNQCFFGIGDVLKAKCSDGIYYEGEIFGIDIKKDIQRKVGFKNDFGRQR